MTLHQSRQHSSDHKFQDEQDFYNFWNFQRGNASVPMNDGMSKSVVRVDEDGGFGAGPRCRPHQGGQGCLQAWICPLQGNPHQRYALSVVILIWTCPPHEYSGYAPSWICPSKINITFIQITTQEVTYTADNLSGSPICEPCVETSTAYYGMHHLVYDHQ